MYLRNANIEATDDQNEVINISGSIVDLNEHAGSIVIYNNVHTEKKNWSSASDNHKGSYKTYYVVNTTPCTIYRNLKRIKVNSGTRLSWRYVRFNKQGGV